VGVVVDGPRASLAEPGVCSGPRAGQAEGLVMGLKPGPPPPPLLLLLLLLLLQLPTGLF